jgi:hypothetical protein
MAKAVAPGTVETQSGEGFQATAVPDPFDSRDLEYRPRLEPLPVSVLEFRLPMMGEVPSPDDFVRDDEPDLADLPIDPL